MRDAERQRIERLLDSYRDPAAVAGDLCREHIGAHGHGALVALEALLRTRPV